MRGAGPPSGQCDPAHGGCGIRSAGSTSTIPHGLLQGSQFSRSAISIKHHQCSRATCFLLASTSRRLSDCVLRGSTSTQLARTPLNLPCQDHQDPSPTNVKGPLPGPMSHLGDKADFTPSPLRVSGSHRGGLTGETNDVVRCYGFALTEQASVILLAPRRNHCSPSVLPAEPGAGKWS